MQRRLSIAWHGLCICLVNTAADSCCQMRASKRPSYRSSCDSASRSLRSYKQRTAPLLTIHTIYPSMTLGLCELGRTGLVRLCQLACHEDTADCWLTVSVAVRCRGAAADMVRGRRAAARQTESADKSANNAFTRVARFLTAFAPTQAAAHRRAAASGLPAARARRSLTRQRWPCHATLSYIGKTFNNAPH